MTSSAQTHHDFGPGLARCSVCQCSPIFNRGCQKCQARFCKSCSHTCSAPISNIVVGAVDVSSLDVAQLTAITACVHVLFEKSQFVGLKVSCTTLGGHEVATIESSGDMRRSELKRCLCNQLSWSDLSFEGFDPDWAADANLDRCDAQFVVKQQEIYHGSDAATDGSYSSSDTLDPNDPSLPWIRIANRTRTAQRGECQACLYQKALNDELGWGVDFLQTIGEPTLQQHTCRRRSTWSSFRRFNR